MIFSVVVVLIVVASIGVWCVAHDLGWSLPTGRIVRAACAAITLAVVLEEIIVQPLTCSDLEPYSLFWYLMLCMGHSS